MCITYSVCTLGIFPSKAIKKLVESSTRGLEAWEYSDISYRPLVSLFLPDLRHVVFTEAQLDPRYEVQSVLVKDPLRMRHAEPEPE